MEWRRRNEWNVGGGSGVRSTDSLVKIGKWSDGEQWVTDRDGASEESEEVITRSRMWFWSWVGKFTCWVKLNDDRRERNWQVAWSEWLSRWMLNSPVMMNSWGVVAAKERKELNSSRKTEKGLEKMKEDDRYWKPIFLNEVVSQLQKIGSKPLNFNNQLFTHIYYPITLQRISSCMTGHTIWYDNFYYSQNPQLNNYVFYL